jgi:hypothetical protein
MRDLFDSMHKGFPAGYFLFWANGLANGSRQIGSGLKGKLGNSYEVASDLLGARVPFPQVNAFEAVSTTVRAKTVQPSRAIVSSKMSPQETGYY